MLSHLVFPEALCSRIIARLQVKKPRHPRIGSLGQRPTASVVAPSPPCRVALLTASPACFLCHMHCLPGGAELATVRSSIEFCLKRLCVSICVHPVTGCMNSQRALELRGWGARMWPPVAQTAACQAGGTAGSRQPVPAFVELTLRAEEADAAGDCSRTAVAALKEESSWRP